MGDFAAKNPGDVTFTELHALTMADVDGDGVKDIITGKRAWAHLDSYSDPDSMGAAVLYWFKTIRDPKAPGGARFVPELIHNRSGVGSMIPGGRSEQGRRDRHHGGNQSRRAISSGALQPAAGGPRELRRRRHQRPAASEEDTMRAVQLARTVSITFGLLLPALAAAHPLDPLTADEIRVAAQVARTDARFASAQFASILLDEPAKADVIAWRPGTTLPRQARLVVMTPASVFEVVADLTARRLVSATERKGVEPPVMMSEFEAAKVVLTNPEFRAALAKRGVTDPEKVFCSPMTAGYFAIPEHAGKRIIKVGCYDLRRTTTNMWGWPIERLYAVVDLRERKVLSVADAGVVPIADREQNFTEAAAGTLRAARKPTVMAQPQGANFAINGNEISWGNWRFHARVDGRVGTVISVARWQDGDRLRSVLYQGYVSEMFVPYMDADYGWYSRTYFDTGEYGAGTMATPLKPGVDCPATAAFLPTTFGDDKGEPITTPNALCIFERGTGDPIWRHAEPLNQTYEGRANVELVVRMAAAVGNYDYLFDWVFNDAAEIDVRVGATGIDSAERRERRGAWRTRPRPRIPATVRSWRRISSP